MTAADADKDYFQKRTRDAHERLDEHEDIHEQFDRRISKNENWRLQAQGALKVIMAILGAGVVGVMLDIVGVV